MNLPYAIKCLELMGFKCIKIGNTYAVNEGNDIPHSYTEEKLINFTLTQLEKKVSGEWAFRWDRANSLGINFILEKHGDNYYLVNYDMVDVRDSTTWIVIDEKRYLPKEMIQKAIELGITPEQLMGVEG